LIEGVIPFSVMVLVILITRPLNSRHNSKGTRRD
jgi:hypothetical protein